MLHKITNVHDINAISHLIDDINSIILTNLNKLQTNISILTIYKGKIEFGIRSHNHVLEVLIGHPVESSSARSITLLI